jgi:signal transduction histidine kinase
MSSPSRRSAVPVHLDIRAAGRLPEPVEIAAYYTVSEALTNTAKHARASAAEVELVAGEGILHVRVGDDRCGGADFGPGSGLVGLRGRVEALGGRISLLSPPGGGGTTLRAELPLTTAGVTSR